VSKLQVYAGDGFEVTFDPKVCIHSAECVRGLPEVFDSRAVPWIRPERGSPERIAAAVAGCPSGALRFARKDAAPTAGTVAEPAGTASIACAPNGPLLLEGAFTVRDASGKVVAAGGKVALCRCGQSSKKPFCDGMHKKVGFSG